METLSQQICPSISGQMCRPKVQTKSADQKCRPNSCRPNADLGLNLMNSCLLIGLHFALKYEDQSLNPRSLKFLCGLDYEVLCFDSLRDLRPLIEFSVLNLRIKILQNFYRNQVLIQVVFFYSSFLN